MYPTLRGYLSARNMGPAVPEYRDLSYAQKVWDDLCPKSMELFVTKCRGLSVPGIFGTNCVQEVLGLFCALIAWDHLCPEAEGLFFSRIFFARLSLFMGSLLLWFTSLIFFFNFACQFFVFCFL